MLDDANNWEESKESTIVLTVCNYCKYIYIHIYNILYNGWGDTVLFVSSLDETLKGQKGQKEAKRKKIKRTLRTKRTINTKKTTKTKGTKRTKLKYLFIVITGTMYIVKL